MLPRRKSRFVQILGTLVVLLLMLQWIVRNGIHRFFQLDTSEELGHSLQWRSREYVASMNGNCTGLTTPAPFSGYLSRTERISTLHGSGIKYQSPNGRVVAVGDVHGDGQALHSLLIAAGIAFAPGGSAALALAERFNVLIVDDTLFAHAGVLLEHVKIGLERIDSVIQSYLRGNIVNKQDIQRITLGENSILWTRAYGENDVRPSVCKRLEMVLEAVGARRLVVGHTVQVTGVNSACGGKVWRIDSGMSAYYQSIGAETPSLLSLENGNASVIVGPHIDA